jgi:hypothetical protein
VGASSLASMSPWLPTFDVASSSPSQRSGSTLYSSEVYRLFCKYISTLVIFLAPESSIRCGPGVQVIVHFDSSSGKVIHPQFAGKMILATKMVKHPLSGLYG